MNFTFLFLLCFHFYVSGAQVKWQQSFGMSKCMYSIVAIHAKILLKLSQPISCILNRYNRRDKKDGLWVLKDSAESGRLSQFGCKTELSAR